MKFLLLLPFYLSHPLSLNKYGSNTLMKSTNGLNTPGYKNSKNNNNNNNNGRYGSHSSNNNNYNKGYGSSDSNILSPFSNNSGSMSSPITSGASDLTNTAGSAAAPVTGGASGFDINDMLNQVNAVRAKAGASPLKLNQELIKAAQVQSNYQAQTNTMSHSGPNGSNVSSRCKQQGYNYKSVAENVAEGQTSVSQVMNSWINSSGHYQNMVGKSYTEFGAAMNNNYWTQVYGSQ